MGGWENGRRLSFSRSARDGKPSRRRRLCRVAVVVAGATGGYVEGVAGNRAGGRVATDFRIGEEGFVSLAVNGGDGDVEGVARVEAEGRRGDVAVVGENSLAVEVFVDGARGDDEVIDVAVLRSFEPELHAGDGVAAGVEIRRRKRCASEAGGHRGHHLRDSRGVERGEVLHLVVGRVLVSGDQGRVLTGGGNLRRWRTGEGASATVVDRRRRALVSLHEANRGIRIADEGTVIAAAAGYPILNFAFCAKLGWGFSRLKVVVPFTTWAVPTARAPSAATPRPARSDTALTDRSAASGRTEPFQDPLPQSVPHPWR